MQRSQVFKVKGMQRDLSMANTQGEFAYEIVNMRLLPAEEDSGLSLTNEQGTLCVIEGIEGDVLGQCPTSDSLVVFTHGNKDRIYKISYNGTEWIHQCLYEGNLNFQTKIEAIFNYETSDIQKVYWIDGINQLRCINLEDYGKVTWNDSSFDSIKQIESLPSVQIERTTGGSFVAGVLQYYISYFTEFGSESPIVYTSPLLYLAHENRGGNVNDPVSTAFKLTLSNLDIANWDSIRIYVTHRTSLDATPEGSIIQELKIPVDGTVEVIDYGLNRVSIAPNDLYFIGGKFVKAGTMTVKDQVMFLGNLDIETPDTIKYENIKSLFDSFRESGEINQFFSTETRKQIPNSLREYQDTYYTYSNQLNNIESITHYKYGEKYRFGISVMDKYGVWSNPIWIKDEFILTPPEQIDSETLELPCPSLNLFYKLESGKTVWQQLQEYGAVSIKPLVVFPKEEERKIIAQGVVCPTVYNLKDRKENGPYAQASWFMRPNLPADLWGISSSVFGKKNAELAKFNSGRSFKTTISHKSDVMTFPLLPLTDNSRDDGDYEHKIADTYAGYYGAASIDTLENSMTGYDYLYDDFSAISISAQTDEVNWNSKVIPFNVSPSSIAQVSTDTLDELSSEDQKDTYTKGSWLEFRHNYALRSKGWSFGYPSNESWSSWYFNKYDSDPYKEFPIYYNLGMVRGAELDTSRFDAIPPVNRFIKNSLLSNNEPIRLTPLYVKDHQNDLYFVTVEDPTTVHNKRKDDENVSVLVLFTYRDPDTKIEYVHIIEAITIPTKATIGTLPTVYGSPNVFINLSNKVLNTSENHKNFLKLKARASSSSTEFKNGERNYYVWEVRDVSGISKEEYITNYMPTTDLYTLGSEDSIIRFGEKPASEFSLGNASYYVDNSIVTLNSPEIELHDFSLSTSTSKFRITGLIPLTATASDISLEVESPSMDYFSLGTGLLKRSYRNTNLGFHGFKGIVGSNAYLTSTDGDTSYSLVPLHPWQTTGTLGKHDNTGDEGPFKSKDILKKKILSNLRYSASTYFFKPDSLQFNGVYDSRNRALLNDKVIGWMPSSLCDIQVFNSEDTSTIIKLNNLNYTTQSLVYKGNIDSIAMLTDGNTDTPLKNPIYSFRDNPLADNTDLDPILRMNSPAVGSYSQKEGKGFYKESQGASIKYKSSPHFVVGFSCHSSLWKSNQRVQETLPAWRYLNEEGISDFEYTTTLENGEFLEHGQLYGDSNVSSIYHQDYIYLNYDESTNSKDDIYNLFRKTSTDTEEIATPNYGWLWLGEIYRTADPTFGGDSQFALENNLWQNADTKNIRYIPGTTAIISYYTLRNLSIELPILGFIHGLTQQPDKAYISDLRISNSGDFNMTIDISYDNEFVMLPSVLEVTGKVINFPNVSIEELDYDQVLFVEYDLGITTSSIFKRRGKITIKKDKNGLLNAECSFAPLFDIVTVPIHYQATSIEAQPYIKWDIGDTYYQRFDTLKTYAHDDSAQNSIVDITSFMVETRVNIDGRYDRNRGQESNLQMSPNNFNLINDIYSQNDNFFTYRILDDDVQNRTNFKNQITWSLSKTAGETIDSWLNVTLASVLDLDGTKGDLTALKTFGNSIVAFQDSGISQILFNSRVQIPTSENVPIQIANSGKVDGQQFITTDIGCQDKWNIVTTSQGLYFIDYRDKSIYKFNGQLANLSATGGFRGWCEKHITDQSTIVGYYDIKNKEVMFYDSNFSTESIADPVWLGFSEMSNHFSSFYTYPEAYLTRVQGIPVWLYNNNVHQHQAGDYNNLLGRYGTYGLTINTRQDSNLVKTFNNVEFRADTYLKDSKMPEERKTFDTIQIEDEYNGPTSATLEFKPYRPSNLKKYLRTWRAQIPRVGNKYNRYVNQWAKIGLWMKAPNTEKTILHDMAVWYSE